jgi:Amiloride-sensitive sodium channel
MNSQRSEIYGDTVFLANCGGLLNLCLGVSVISIFEILYYCTVRFFFNFRGNKGKDQEEKVLAENLQYTGSNARKFVKITKDLVTVYSQEATIQGINYVADKKLPLVERLWWAFFTLVSIICCGSLIAKVLSRYNESPMVISYENEETLASQVSISFSLWTFYNQYF